MEKRVLSIANSTQLEEEERLVDTRLSGLMGILVISSLSGAGKQATLEAMQKALMDQLCKVCTQGGVCGVATPPDTKASERPGDIASLGQGDS